MKRLYDLGLPRDFESAFGEKGIKVIPGEITTDSSALTPEALRSVVESGIVAVRSIS
jgi:hypothetical protein